MIYPDGKRYLSLDSVLKREFGKKTVKVPLNAGLGCPNRDGSKGIGGCIFCSGRCSGEFAGNPCESLYSQFEAVKALYLKKWGETNYIAYLQAGSNTYSDPEALSEIYESCLKLPAVGLSIATRADCITPQIADLLYGISKRTYLTVELGLQSSSDITAGIINRGHTFGEFLTGYGLLFERGIRVCVHIINGLPGETRRDMLKTAGDVARLNPYEIKIHLLHIIKGTAAERMYLDGRLAPMDKNEYTATVCDQLELLPPSTAIGRLTGDGDRKTLIAPMWSTDKKTVLNSISKELSARESFQGKYYSK
ncbi:MAG TPA: TIGR01212 family radical SAM protein [Candidatus Faeciplasma avium]|uniref:TIGR01212 family radical SAM protein n=1 Tax=Candidatus Faeciplasma avium TaxID=2840798 RepID=A0A9D1NQK9_9FIRM|nr:TIGR01212 family radical SAM protein [Candidatus Faeciplasma avium]